MSFSTEVKAKYSLVVSKPISFEKGLHINKEGGPAGPLRIDEARDWEIIWENGRPNLLTPRVLIPQGKDMPENPEHRPDLTWDRGGSNTGTIPNNPNAPLDKLNYVTKDRKITEEKITMSYMERLAVVLALTNPSLTFQDVLKIVKSLYPDLKMQFPHPPTFVWNPKKEDTPKEDEKDQRGGEGEKEGDVDEEAKLDPQKIKETLKVKLSQLTWTTRMFDGVEEAELGFDDESHALFEIGAKANHLTLTYFEPPKGTQLKYDDSETEDTTSP